MEHIRQHDWCSSKPDTHFVTEKDINNCVIERILRNKFQDPLLSSDNTDSEDDSKRLKIDWDEVFKTKHKNFKQNHYIPGMHTFPPCPKLSAMTGHQHFQMLKVLNSRNPNVLCPHPVYYNPSRIDLKVFEELKDTYEKEQKEFQEWAKALWTNDHCVRALRPKPTIEMVYEAEFKMKASQMAAFPKRYEMAALIPFDNSQGGCEIVCQKSLLKVNMSQLPSIEYPDMTKKCTILTPCPVPEPCTKHPVRFVLPNEQTMSILPITEVHRELAQYACDNGAQYIASENSLKCMVETDRHWSIPVSVCQAIGPEGEKVNIFVFGSEFSNNREPAQTRTYKAFRHLVETAFVSASEKTRIFKENENAAATEKKKTEVNNVPKHNTTTEDLSSDDEDHLVIADDVSEINVPDFIETAKPKQTKSTEPESKEDIIEKRVTRSMSKSDVDDEYDDIDESKSNHDQNCTTKIDCPIDDPHDLFGAESDDETDDFDLDWTKTDDSEINASKMDDCNVNEAESDDCMINETEFDDSEIDGTLSDDNEIDAATKQNDGKRIQPKKSTLTDMSDYDSDATMPLEVVSDPELGNELTKKEKDENIIQTRRNRKAHTKTRQIKKEIPFETNESTNNHKGDDQDSDGTAQLQIKLEPDTHNVESPKNGKDDVSQSGKKRRALVPKGQKFSNVIDDDTDTEATVQREIILESETQTAETSKKDNDEYIPQSTAKKRKAHKNIENQESEVHKKDVANKDCDRRDSFYKCTCEDSVFKKPPQRSFTKYLVKNEASQEKFDLIVHCSHKYRDQSCEVILEPVPEYQIDLGASYQSPQKLTSLALSLHLHTCPVLLNVRIDSPSGDIVRIDDMRRDLLEAKLIREAASIIHSALSQLQGLMPGHYILQHEPSHGTNALLFAPRVTSAKGKQRLTLEFDCSQMADMDESKSLKTPTLTDILLPAHKFRRILPCAFSPFEHHVAKESKKPVAKQKPPPQAIKWPKKKRGRKKKKRNNN